MEHANEDIDCELLNNEFPIHSPASLEHELIFKFLLNIVDLNVHQRAIEVVLGSRFTMRLTDKWV